MCERELETEQNCNILTPTLLAITAFLSRSLGLLNQGHGGPASLGHVPQSSIFSPTGLISKLTDFLSSPSYIIVQRPLLVGVTIALIQPIRGQGYNILIIPRPDAPVIYIGVFPILTARLGRRSIYNTSSLGNFILEIVFVIWIRSRNLLQFFIFRKKSFENFSWRGSLLHFNSI